MPLSDFKLRIRFPFFTNVLFQLYPFPVIDGFIGSIAFSKVKFGNIGFSIGKSENSGFFRNYSNLSPKSW